MRWITLISVVVAAACAVGLYLGAYAYFKAEELEKAAARLTLYRSTIQAELRHFAHLPFVISLDPVVADTLAGGDPDKLDKRLAQIAQSAGIDAIYLMDETGLTISASNAGAPGSFKGQNYAFRPYFQAALRGELGEFYGIGATTGIPGYFYALRVKPEGSESTGVIAIKLDLSWLQNSWQASGERIVLSNADGVALLASDPQWRYRTLEPLTQSQKERIVQTRQFGNETLDALPWSLDLALQTAAISGRRYLYLRTSELPNDWTLHFFAPDDQAVTRAWLTAGLVVVLGGALFAAAQVRRVRRIGAALRQSEQEEAELRSANERLAVEIEDRRAAEATLKKTQAELERAGRLAALGQLASSVTHELGQPIAAMRNHLAAAEMTDGETALTNKMQGLVVRMEEITKQLKFFSRKGRDQFETFDLVACMSDALDLLAPSLEDVQLHFDRSAKAIKMHGNRLRIEQVMTNIVRNAIDAMEGSELRRIDIRMGHEPGTVWFEIADTGHGLGDTSLEELREPFATTRESGKGMGLGLTISAGIVSDHHGIMTARNAQAVGAIFRVEFPSVEEAGQ